MYIMCKTVTKYYTTMTAEQSQPAETKPKNMVRRGDRKLTRRITVLVTESERQAFLEQAIKLKKKSEASFGREIMAAGAAGFGFKIEI